MLHCFMIQLSIEATDQADLRDDLQEKFNMLGGESLVSQSKEFSQVGVVTGGGPPRVTMRAFHRFAAEVKVEDVLAAIVEAFPVSAFDKLVKYHACYHDQRMPCKKWQTLLDEA